MAGGICIASTGGGSGKTLLSLGLCRALANAGIPVRPFKKGPDYIDAAWLSAAARVPAINLDPFFLEPDALRRLFCQGLVSYDVGVVEGNRGLYDGLDEKGTYSTASLARILKIPVLLCLDCTKSVRTAAAVAHGLLTFEAGLDFCGVILNKTGSPRHEAALRRAMEAAIDVPVLGAIPRMEKEPLPERHMGIATPGPDIEKAAGQKLDEIGRIVRDNCDLPAIMARARAAAIPECSSEERNQEAGPDDPAIGYVFDSALWFYYPENLKALQREGARTVRLSLFDDSVQAWEGLSGLYLGGGFPEDFAGAISRSPALKKIAELAAREIPIYAECGGLIVLSKGIEAAGRFYPMAGIFDIALRFGKRPQGLGYAVAKVAGVNPFYPAGLVIKGHEFHYSSCVAVGADQDFALELERGAGILNGRDGLCRKNTWGSYLHVFAPAVPEWAKNFVALARSFKS